MKILIISIGTRGDIEPFLAVGRILKNYGHKVYCAIPEQYGYLAQNMGLEFRSLGPNSWILSMIRMAGEYSAMKGTGFNISCRSFGISKNISETAKTCFDDKRPSWKK